MVSYPPLGWLLGFVTLGLALGCAAPYRSRDVGVTVRDAETHEPIPAATVQISHHHTSSDLATATSGSDGIARVSFQPEGNEPSMIEASAAGHTSEFQVVGDAALEQIPPVPIFGSAAARSPDIVIDLYAQPAFGVELALPQNYRGLLKVALDFRDDAPVPRGQRIFSFEASATGEVKGIGPGLLRRVPASTYQARYPDGTSIGEKMDDTVVGLRWLKREEGWDLFVVGNAADFERYRKEAGPSATSQPPASDAPKRGRGGHGGGRHGGGGGGGGGM